MATPNPSIKERKRRKAYIEKLYEEGYAPLGMRGGKGSAAQKAGRDFGMTRGGGMSHWIRTEEALAARGEKAFVPDASLYKPPDTLKPIEEVAEDNKLKNRVRDLEAMNRRLLEDNQRLDRLFGHMEILKGMGGETPLSPWPVKDMHAGLPGTPVLNISDVQYGEVIEADQVRGINEYNPTIARARVGLLFDKTVELCTHHQPNPDYPNGIVVNVNGDLISGGIHKELRETDHPTSQLGQMYGIMELLADGLVYLADKFGRVEVWWTPGNHGRNTEKPQAKGYASNNYEYWAGRFVADRLQNDDRITIHIPDDGDALYQLHGYWFVSTHGDQIGTRGGRGFIGPVATIARGMQLVRQYYASLGVTVSKVILGHFHDECDLVWGFANGAISGAGEFGRSNRMVPRQPSQWLIFVHPKYLISQRWSVQLGPRPLISVDE